MFEENNNNDCNIKNNSDNTVSKFEEAMKNVQIVFVKFNHDY